MNIFLTNQEEAALMKKFDHNGDGVISMEEFYETLQACMWIWGFKPWHLSDLQPA